MYSYDLFYIIESKIWRKQLILVYTARVTDIYI